MHLSIVKALRGQPFPHLGQSPVTAAAARVGGRLPWPVLRNLYARMGAAEAVRPSQLGAVDMTRAAGWLADQIPARTYPGVLLGSSNGALIHLAAATQVPFLPGTVLVPVRRSGSPADVQAAMRFGVETAPPLLERNPGVALHHMHDQLQDELMVAQMAYFRLKWTELPDPYAAFLKARLAPAAPVILVEDESTWPVVRIGPRHVFQPGAQGGVEPGDYLRRPRTPRPDDVAPEAEWGADPGFSEAVARWCSSHGHPLIRLVYSGPQAPSGAVATTFRSWYRQRDEDDTRLLVPSFVAADPWLTINTASVPFWAFFAVQPALTALQDHLEQSDPYREVHVMLFEHGVRSPGIARPADWARVVRASGARVDFVGLDRSRFPHDIGFLGRYGPRLATLSRATKLWSPLPVNEAVNGLATNGLSVHR
jgi:hypothetical protein